MNTLSRSHAKLDVSATYTLTLSATSGAAADGVAANTITATLMSGSTYVSGKSIIFSVTVGSALFSSSETDTVTVTTDALGEASAPLTDTVEETATIKAFLTEDASVNASASSTFRNSDNGTLPAPSVTEAINGILAYTLSEAHVIVPTATLTVGDTIQIVWSGTLADGSPVADYTAHNTVVSLTKNLSFIIPASHISPLAGGSVDVSYTDVTTGDTSDVLHLSVTDSDSGWLDAPVVVEASGSSLSSSVTQATVNIASYTGMAAGDIVSLDWDGNVTGKYPLTQTVTGNSVGSTLTFTVPSSQIKGNATVGLNYTVQPADGSATLISWPLGLNVI